MPRAIEIRVDPITKGVIIDTNFPNREVLGAGWEPQLFRLGWDTPEEIWLAMQDAVPTLICPRVSLRDSYESDASVLIQAGDATDVIVESALRMFFPENSKLVALAKFDSNWAKLTGKIGSQPS